MGVVLVLIVLLCFFYYELKKRIDEMEQKVGKLGDECTRLRARLAEAEQRAAVDAAKRAACASPVAAVAQEVAGDICEAGAAGDTGATGAAGMVDEVTVKLEPAYAAEASTAVQPQAVQPQAVQPQAVQPQAVQPQAVQPQAVQPQAVAPAAAMPNASSDMVPLRPAWKHADSTVSCETPDEGACSAEDSSKDAARWDSFRNWLLYGHSDISDASGIERQVAFTWLMRAGILVLLLSVGFLLKLAIAYGWIPPVVRVGLSFLAGSGLVCFGISCPMRGKYWRLGQGIAGFGLGILYFGSYSMSALYGIAPAWGSGVLALFWTVTAGCLSYRMKSLCMGLVALFGGHLSVFMLIAPGFSPLFAYVQLFILSIGVLLLERYRGWYQLTRLCMICAYVCHGRLFFGGHVDGIWSVSLTFLTALFVIYGLSVYVWNGRHGRISSSLEVAGLLFNSGLYVAFAWLLLHERFGGDKLCLLPLPVCLAVYHGVHSYVFFRRDGENAANLAVIFQGLTWIFIAMSFPLVLSERWYVAAWAVEAVVVYVLSERLRSRILEGVSFVFAVVSVFCWLGEMFSVKRVSVLDWGEELSNLVCFIIPGFCTYVLGWRLHECVKATGDNKDQKREVSLVMACLGLCMCAWCMNLEAHRMFVILAPEMLSCVVSLGWCVVVVLAYWLLKREMNGMEYLTFIALLLMGFNGMFLDYTEHGCEWYRMSRVGGYRWLGLLWRVVNCGILFGCIMWVCGRFRALGERCRDIPPWLIASVGYGLLLVYGTFEVHGLCVAFLPGLASGGISLLWSAVAFTLVYLGLRREMKYLRYTGLLLFAIVVGKVFLLDLARLDVFWRALASLLFGVLLVGASFLYLRLGHGREE